MKIFLTTLLILFFITNCNAQSENSDTTIAYNLTVLSNPDGASVYLDSTLIGKTPLNNFTPDKNTFVLKVINPVSLSRWEDQNYRSAINLTSDTTINIKFDLNYFFSTNPFNANVIYHDSIIGVTPLRYFSKEKLSGNIIFKKENYVDRIFDLKNYNFETGYSVNLERLENSSNNIVFKNRSTEFKTKRNFLMVGTFGAATLLSAYTTIILKNKANDSYDKYLISYNNADLDDANRNDIYSAISLVIMQITLAGVIYFLFLD